MSLRGTDSEGLGSAPALFVGTVAFKVTVEQQIKRLEEPGLNLPACL